MSGHKIIEGLKQAVTGQAARYSTYLRCGSCKGGTGYVHVWNKNGDLVPVEPPELCPHCDGHGMVRIA